jgi:diaminopimelate epimerase
MLPNHFVKMAGGGNDFLVFETDGHELSQADRRQIALLCRRGLSVGADGVLCVCRAGNGSVRLDYFNADGGAADFCANGTRCAARYAVDRRLVSTRDPVVETGWAPIASHVESGAVTLELPAFAGPAGRIAISAEGLPGDAIAIDVGVPHLVVFVENDLESVDVKRLAPPLRRHPLLPAGANVNFVQVLSPKKIAVRTFERGVEGETLACGSGVVASAVVAACEKRVTPPVECGTKSGVDFRVSFREEQGRISGVTLTGDAREIYTGELTQEASAP